MKCKSLVLDKNTWNDSIVQIIGIRQESLICNKRINEKYTGKVA